MDSCSLANSGARAAVIGLFAVYQRYLNDVRPVAVFFGHDASVAEQNQADPR